MKPSKMSSLQEKLRLQDRFRAIQEKMDALENKYQTRALSTKIWPPNAVEDDVQRSKANLLYAFLMICFICLTANEFMTRIISSIKDPIFESTYEKESFKFPVVTICGSEFMSRNHSFPYKDGHGCEFYDHMLHKTNPGTPKLPKIHYVSSKSVHIHKGKDFVLFESNKMNGSYKDDIHI